jgi:hypothetical protein
MKSVADDLLHRFGNNGFPLCLDKKYEPTWESYTSLKNVPKDRIFNVLGFLHLLCMSQVKVPVDPYIAYRAMLKDTATNAARTFVSMLRRSRVLDLFKVRKTIVLYDDNSLYVNLSIVPKRNETLDSALLKAEGSMYYGSLPIQLQERWKKLPINSRAKPQSSLPTENFLIHTGTVANVIPLDQKDDMSLYASRACKDVIVLRFVIRSGFERPAWFDHNAQHVKQVTSAFKQAFNSLAKY